MNKRRTTSPQAPARAAELRIQLPGSTGETSLCNAFFNDRKALPGFCLCTFGLVLQGQVVNRWCFAFEERNLKILQQSLLTYLTQIRSIIQVPRFKNPSIPIYTSPVTPRPVDHLALAYQDSTAEFAFHGWSWNAVTVAATQIGADKQSIQAHLYLVLRCSLALQVAWLTDVYAAPEPGPDTPGPELPAAPRDGGGG